MNQPKKRLCIDWDGTIVKSNDLVCAFINYKRGTNFTTKDLNNWDFWKNRGQENDFWETWNFLDKYELRITLKPYDIHTTSVLYRLMCYYDVHIVTCNNPIQEQIYTWLQINGLYGWLRMSNCFKVECLGHIPPEEKLKLDFDIFIDDNPNMAKLIENYDKKLFLANCRWNEDVADTEKVTRFRSWEELERLLWQ